MKKFKTGVVVGKFYPPHAGHSHLIETALAGAEKVTVMVAGRPEHQIPGKLRAQWLQQAHPTADVRVFNDVLGDNDTPAWAKSTIKFLGHKPDVVFSSESYGPRWAEAMGSAHVAVDNDRSDLPISATMVRRDPYKAWQYLAPSVRGYFALRVVIAGAESTGKTTLAQDLAKHYRTEWVSEYGRQFTEENVKNVFNHKWTNQEFKHIAQTQNQLEDEAAERCHKVLICDTDSFATSVWYERYFGERSAAVEKLAAGRIYDLYIVPDINTPFFQDGWRDGEHIRTWMHRRFLDKLEFWGKDYLLVSGSSAERVEQAAAVIDELLKTNHRLSGQKLADKRPDRRLQKAKVVDSSLIAA